MQIYNSTAFLQHGYVLCFFSAEYKKRCPPAPTCSHGMLHNCIHPPPACILAAMHKLLLFHIINKKVLLGTVYGIVWSNKSRAGL